MYICTMTYIFPHNFVQDYRFMNIRVWIFFKTSYMIVLSPRRPPYLTLAAMCGSSSLIYTLPAEGSFLKGSWLKPPASQTGDPVL